MKKILLFSGGLDSVIANRIVKPDLCVHFNVKVKYSEMEVYVVRRFKDMGVIQNLSVGYPFNFSEYELDDATIPLRNSYLLSGAVNEGIIEYPDETEFEIYLTVQKDEMSIPDRSEKFINISANLLSLLSNAKVSLHLPFKYSDKTAMVKEFLDKGFDEYELLHSYSCYTGDAKECGDCPCCFRKWVALANNDITEDVWKVSPWLSKTAEDYINRLEEYSEDRQNRMKSAFLKQGRLI